MYRGFPHLPTGQRDELFGRMTAETRHDKMKKLYLRKRTNKRERKRREHDKSSHATSHHDLPVDLTSQQYTQHKHSPGFDEYCLHK